MAISYKGVIIPGVIAGILIGLMQIFGLCCWPVDFIVLLAAGALAAHLSTEAIRDQNDVLISGGLAGLIGGILGGILYTIMSMVTAALMQLVLGSMSTRSSLSGTGSGSLPFLSGVYAGAIGVICCLPALIVAGIVLGALGALAYYTFRKRPVDASVI